MDYPAQEKDHQIESTLLNFIFLLALIINAIIITDLFLSILKSPLTLIFIRVMIMLTVLGFLAANGFRHPEIRGRGWYFLLSGFSLIFLGTLTELLSRMPYTRNVIYYLGQPVLSILENIFFQLFGFFCLAYGFFLWIPSILEARRKMEQTAIELELKVRERTKILRELNEQLSRSNLKLEQAIRLKNEFLASFSHELKTPLNSILGFCRLLREERQGPLTDKQHKSIAIIDSNSKSLLEQINRILDFAKLEFEKISVSIQEVNLSGLLKELVEVVEPLLKGKPIDLSVQEDEKLNWINTDRKILFQLLLGILDNAIKFTESGSIRILTGQHSDQKNWWITLSDTGLGISDKELPFIFDAFRQGDGSLSKSYGGTGLGLTIVRKLTLLLGGTINVKSTLGSGTTFTVSFPLTPEQPPAELARSSTESPDNGRVPQK
ncbi:MAG TPA: HAMP domain-containing sensor histidine kinase [archaeon]|nr:HAMP domain-containing sensor histidine kinase [archaeon]